MGSSCSTSDSVVAAAQEGNGHIRFSTHDEPRARPPADDQGPNSGPAKQPVALSPLEDNPAEVDSTGEKSRPEQDESSGPSAAKTEVISEIRPPNVSPSGQEEASASEDSDKKISVTGAAKEGSPDTEKINGGASGVIGEGQAKGGSPETEKTNGGASGRIGEAQRSMPDDTKQNQDKEDEFHVLPQDEEDVDEGVEISDDEGDINSEPLPTPDLKPDKMAGIGDLCITKPAPAFETQAVVGGDFKTVKLSDYRGKYVVIFFYPLDFTFVCPTEIIAFSDRVEEFRAINCEVLACSTDSVYSHLAWVNTPRKQGGLGNMSIPLLADKTMEISKKYGCLKEDEGVAFRGLYIIDGKGNLRQITINDLPVGRSVDETLRLVQAFQFTDQHGEVCPAGWRPGKETMKPDPKGSKTFFDKVN